MSLGNIIITIEIAMINFTSTNGIMNSRIFDMQRESCSRSEFKYVPPASHGPRSEREGPQEREGREGERTRRGGPGLRPLPARTTLSNRWQGCRPAGSIPGRGGQGRANGRQGWRATAHPATRQLAHGPPCLGAACCVSAATPS